jgi:rSAM/selenodomain-associated transferase 2/rSAM/selenodomain-associated transferase 1
MSSSRPDGKALCIVMPVFNEGRMLTARLKALVPLRKRGVELVVVDGGSTDDTWAIASALADHVLLAPKGRASQMNAGAHNATAGTLIFLHADTHLPEGADQLIALALQAGHDWGRFDVQIESTRGVLRGVARLMNQRSRLTGIATGDQAMFVKRAVFESLGGFADMPLMEDVELSTRLQRRGPPACISTPVITSGRRWEQHGVWRTITLMWWLRAAYFFGAAPDALARRYGYAPQPESATAATAIFARAPLPGLAKTRLIPALGPQGAARAQRRFTRNTLRVAVAAATGPVTLWCAPDADQRFFTALHRVSGVALQSQCDGDLGTRMQHACTQHFASQPDQPLLLIGTDCPVLAPGHLQAAARALRQHEVVIVPAEDGGYVLVGMRRLVPELFQRIDWSTVQVMSQTRERLTQAGATWLEMPTLWDVDEPADWRRLQGLLRG